MPTSPSRLTRLVAGLLPAVLLATSTAHAFRPPQRHTLAEKPFELDRAIGASPVARAVSFHAPAQASAAALDAFTARRGSWQALWDSTTQVPLRLWGAGIAAPGSVADADAAAQAARAVLDQELALLAPTTASSDFVLISNELRADVRTVAFGQRHAGLAVEGATVRFSFKHDRLVSIASTAAPDLTSSAPSTFASSATARSRARQWIASLHAGNPTVVEQRAAVVLPMTLDGATRGRADRAVIPIVVETAVPIGKWTVYVDAVTGDPVARRQEVMFGAGTVRYHVPVRYPAGGAADYPAQLATHRVDGSPVTSDLAGALSWSGTAPATVAPAVAGPLVSVTTATGTPVEGSLSLDDGGAVTWDRTATVPDNAQLAMFIHVNLAKQFALTTLNPDLPWLSQTIPVTVNHTEETGGYVCNALSNGDDIHFFVANSVDLGDGTFFNCGNTGELADVAYHEFGHSLHAQSLTGNNFDYALSEGTSDYLAATIVNDPDMGKGFNADTPDVGLRHIDPEGREYVYPQDLTGESHNDGQIISGALWDLRKALIAELGAEAGAALTDDIYYGIISRADDIPSSYIEALVTDDDDGNLANGTPNHCTIQAAFGAHGLGETGALLSQLEPPTANGTTVSMQAPELPGGDCPTVTVAQVSLTWRLQDDPGTGGTIAMTLADDAYAATLPTGLDGHVVEYQVTASLSGDAGIRTFPAHQLDPYYRLYAGPVTPIYCTDFEEDPTADGWSLGSNFHWGVPTGSANGYDDPTAAFSGTRVLGTFLDAGGIYLPDMVAVATSPSIDVSGYDHVRLQYRRWLTSEVAVYDSATVAVDGNPLFSSSDQNNFLDSEWRYEDFDLTAAAADGTVQLQFGLTTDGSVELGGWNVDDLCIVGIGPDEPVAVCGNGEVEGDEECDDGNVTDDDGCSATCTDEETPPPVIDEDSGCCSTGGGGAAGSALLALALLGLLAPRRRRRA